METWIEVEGATIWTKQTGTGTFPVLLVSGGPGAADYMDAVADLLVDDCKVIQFDPRGCGRSTEDGTTFTIEACLCDIEVIRKYYGFSQWTVVGHSWGADLGLAYALKYPDALHGFLSLAGTGIQNDRDWKEAYVANRQKQGERLPEFLYPLNKDVHRSLLTSWRDFIKHPDLLNNLAKLDVPTLFVVAGEDIRPSWPIQQLAKLVPHANYTVVEGAGHYLWLSKPEVLKRLLVKFITTPRLKETTHENHKV
ncbi:alpha/beta fold hydrolase [Chryseomicrobium palamuruense]|uniref:Alpha/beta fold hydrolase n=1 Tax=Chryseomicrobium palamuruense TaxID=682973 RepID=A0ABV8UY61_9BACL